MIATNASPAIVPVINSDGRLIIFQVEDGVANGLYLWDAATRGVTLLTPNWSNTGPANGSSVSASVTPDFRFIAFQSTSTDLVTNALNTASQLYVRDLQTGVTRLAGLNSTGQAASEDLQAPIWLSDDGRLALFQRTRLSSQAIATETRTCTA